MCNASLTYVNFRNLNKNVGIVLVTIWTSRNLRWSSLGLCSFCSCLHICLCALHAMVFMRVLSMVCVLSELGSFACNCCQQAADVIMWCLSWATQVVLYRSLWPQAHSFPHSRSFGDLMLASSCRLVPCCHVWLFSQLFASAMIEWLAQSHVVICSLLSLLTSWICVQSYLGPWPSQVMLLLRCCSVTSFHVVSAISLRALVSSYLLPLGLDFYGLQLSRCHIAVLLLLAHSMAWSAVSLLRYTIMGAVIDFPCPLPAPSCCEGFGPSLGMCAFFYMWRLLHGILDTHFICTCLYGDWRAILSGLFGLYFERHWAIPLSGDFRNELVFDDGIWTTQTSWDVCFQKKLSVFWEI